MVRYVGVILVQRTLKQGPSCPRSRFNIFIPDAWYPSFVHEFNTQPAMANNLRIGVMFAIPRCTHLRLFALVKQDISIVSR
jgi:hypothetical protein